MPEVTVTAARTRGQIVGELRALVSLQADDRRQLAEVERHELLIIGRVDDRQQRIDVVLDELVDWEALHAMETLG